MPAGRPVRRRGGPGRGRTETRRSATFHTTDSLSPNASQAVDAGPSRVTGAVSVTSPMASRLRERSPPVIRQGRRRAIDRRAIAERDAVYRARPQQRLMNQALMQDVVECHYSGPMNVICQYCQALHFKAEKTSDHFSDCCQNGKIDLPPIQQHPVITGLLQISPDRANFLENIREYNSALAMGSLTTSGALHNLPGRGPYSLKVHGEAYRLIGDLQVLPGQKPIYAQLFYVDNATAQAERMCRPENKNCKEHIMESLSTMLLEVNPYVQSINYLKEVEKEEKDSGRGTIAMSLYFLTDKAHDQRRYNLPTSLQEIGAVFVSSDGAPPSTDARDVVFNLRSGGVQCMNITNPLADPFLYPLLFPFGERGWTTGIAHVGPNRTNSRNRVTLLGYYGFRLAKREGFSGLHASGKLFQQFVIDAYLKKEGNDLAFIRANQRQLRAECYKGLQDYMLNIAGNSDLQVGRMIVLPSSFIGSPRNMHQHYQDAMAVVRQEGKPDYFITFTCNPKWREITENLQEGEQPHFRPDLIVRVFNLKLNALLEQLTKKNVLGKVSSYVYVVEFQKRGLPHAHILLIMENDFKPREIEEIDAAITAELPDAELQPQLHELVKSHMIHGPCGSLNMHSPCMKEGVCSKSFPKGFTNQTQKNLDGFPLYKRRNNGVTCNVGPASKPFELDNRWVVPTNLYLLQMFECHINVEMCQTVKSVKYLYKYLHKGYDCADVEGRATVHHDEIKMYMDSRYIGSMESAFRLFGSKCMGQSHAVVRLPVHLPNEDTVYFQEGHEEEALQRSSVRKSKLEAYFELNSIDGSAHAIAYPNIPVHFKFHAASCKWKKRLRGSEKVISRMYTVSPKDLERFSLRILLLTVTGAKSFQELRTHRGRIFDTFHEAALARGLLKDDSQWEATLADAATFRMPNQMRDLFAYILINGCPSNPAAL